MGVLVFGRAVRAEVRSGSLVAIRKSAKRPRVVADADRILRDRELEKIARTSAPVGAQLVEAYEAGRAGAWQAGGRERRPINVAVIRRTLHAFADRDGGWTIDESQFIRVAQAIAKELRKR